MARITPEELSGLIAAGPEGFEIVDLRHQLERRPEPVTIPGALALSPGELAAHRRRLAGRREVVLFCT